MLDYNTKQETILTPIGRTAIDVSLNSELSTGTFIMQKEAQALLDAAIAFKNAGATPQQINFMTFLRQNVMTIQISLPVTQDGMQLKLGDLTDTE